MGMGIGDWGLGIGDWAQSPIPNPPSPIPNKENKIIYIFNINIKIILNKIPISNNINIII